ncbi:tRNA (N6-threonylcarbamoyladenosine(37)-N6)-methyltransferase TrmO [Methanoregula formicica]|uniref:Putative methyltransferase, YaeB/AF_0241 family n=1 Tax=Methanoregula formicica (strain DSM 22288 / NBRC 105244 / SMSP) TaxID=593750 RepID=L0HAD2_METFS|nr:tRNA (N6-threonylcarbamoyladenosine(37)-N6)-methyltransferase TrmO [Methanoregula formicica]AGB01677.1 putative methyltransferase, YaeB/AF_0241 family [Methanoregula formicica SMSP]
MRTSSRKGDRKETMMDFRPIGIAHSELTTRGAPPFQSSFSQATGTIEVFFEYREGLRDIEGFSHLIILSHFNQAEKRALAEKPLLDGEANHGIFATRHFNRPNPIGISYVALTGITDGVLSVKGIDLLDGTPVLDIKPYIPAFDSIPDAAPGWVTTTHVGRLREAGSGIRQQ